MTPHAPQAPRSVFGRAPRVFARMPLRVRLVGLLLVLVIAGLVGAGAAAITTMRSYLSGRVDTQLQAVAGQPIERLMSGQADLGPGGGGGGGGRGDHGDGDHGRGLPSAFVVAVSDPSGKIVYGPASTGLRATEPLPVLPRVRAAEARERGTQTFTTPAVSGSGQWRVLAKAATLTSGAGGTLFVAQSMGDVETIVSRLTNLLLLIGAVTVVILAAVGYLVVRASLRPLGKVEATAAAIAGGDLSQRVPPIDPRTEVGQLSGALNTMLAEIELAFAERAASESAARTSEERMRRSEAAARESEERMRQFVANASHELRTPLTTIRGFAELYRQGAAPTAEDVARCMRRIEDEATRMGMLVEDLLLLARLDQERPLERTPVDMLALARDAVQDAVAVDPKRPIRLEVGDADPPPIVLGDEMRLRQVLANLVTNAVTHTPPGTPVTVGVTTSGAQPTVMLTVADSGPGMTREDAARAFERFYRADTSRSRAAGGTGLGLSIVAALVAGHGGSVEVLTAPGEGATFRVRLPLAAAAG